MNAWVGKPRASLTGGVLPPGSHGRVIRIGQNVFLKANPDKAAGYKAAIEEFQTSKKSLMAWLETEPKRTEENTKKFEGFNKRIGEAEKALKAFH